MRNQLSPPFNNDPFTQKLFEREIRNHKPLTDEEENTLFKKVREGDRKSLARIIEANAKFVEKTAKQYLHQGPTLMDLVQEGLLALSYAAKKYDETRGLKFLSYASHWVTQYMLRAVTKHGQLTKSIFSSIPEKDHCIADMLCDDWNERPDAQLMKGELRL